MAADGRTVEAEELRPEKEMANANGVSGDSLHDDASDEKDMEDYPKVIEGHEKAGTPIESARIEIEIDSSLSNIAGGENDGDRVIEENANLEKESDDRDTAEDSMKVNDGMPEENIAGDMMEGGEGEDEDDGHGEEENDDMKQDEDPSKFIQEPLADNKKHTALEIYVGKLDKGAVEEDLITIFGKFGEIQDARVVRNSSSNKSKGFAFVRYATSEQAEKALSESKDGIEVRGKQVTVSLSLDKNTLYVNNISKSWTKEKVLEKLKALGVEQIKEMYFPACPSDDGTSRGFAYLEFDTHPGAMAACKRLRMPDAIFGCDKSAKVAFAQYPSHCSADVHSQIKTVHVQGLPSYWDELKVKEIFQQYGEVQKVELSRRRKNKRNDKVFGFVTFTSPENALSCIKGINSAPILEGTVKVKAEIARLQARARIQKHCGGFKVRNMDEGNTDGGTEQSVLLKSKTQAKSKGDGKKNGKPDQPGPSSIKNNTKHEVPKQKGKAVTDENIQSGRKVVGASELGTSNPKKRRLPSKDDHLGRGGVKPNVNRPSFKKARGSQKGKKRAFGDRSNPRDSVPYGNFRPSAAHISNPKRRYLDMEPHAGYVGPSPTKQVHPHLKYVEPAFGTQVARHAGYAAPALGEAVLPYAGYLHPTADHPGRLQSYGMKRSDQYGGEGSRFPSYGEGSAVSTSSVLNHQHYAGYEGAAADYYYGGTTADAGLRRGYY